MGPWRRPRTAAAGGRPLARRRRDGYRGTGLTHPAPGYAHLDGDPDAHSTWFLDTHRRVRRERARLRLGLARHGPSAQHRRHCDLLAPDPLQRRRACRDSHAPTVTAPEIALPRHLRQLADEARGNRGPASPIARAGDHRCHAPRYFALAGRALHVPDHGRAGTASENIHRRRGSRTAPSTRHYSARNHNCACG